LQIDSFITPLVENTCLDKLKSLTSLKSSGANNIRVLFVFMFRVKVMHETYFWRTYAKLVESFHIKTSICKQNIQGN